MSDSMSFELTTADIERLDREEEVAYKTSETPLVDLLMPNHDWEEEALMDLYRQEVERIVGSTTQIDDWDAFFDHFESCFRRGISERECVMRWKHRSN